jgi:hypothetical protein
MLIVGPAAQQTPKTLAQDAETADFEFHNGF